MSKRLKIYKSIFTKIDTNSKSGLNPTKSNSSFKKTPID